MDKLEIKKQVWVNSPGKQFSVDLHEGTEGRVDYLMITEHARGGKRYRISVPVTMVPRLIEALKETTQPQV